MKKIFLSSLLIIMSTTSMFGQIVINNFEPQNSNFNNATFRNKNGSSFNIDYCNVDTNLHNFYYPTFNILNSSSDKATLVSNVNEPILAAINPQIIRPTISSTGGTRALRLNDTSTAHFDITSYKEKFLAITKYVTYQYFAVLASDHPDRDIQPMFRARLLDQYNEVIPGTEFCLIAEQQDPNLQYQSEIFFTDNWYCNTIAIPEEYINQQIFIEFVVADCGAGAHKGVLYLDNIYNSRIPCEESPYGFINLEDYKFDTCQYNSGLANDLFVSGIYQEPSNSTISNVSLILENTNNSYQVNINSYNFSNGQFDINGTVPNNLPNGDYEIKIVAEFQSNNNFMYSLEDISVISGPDISISNTPLIVNIEHDEMQGIIPNPPYWNATNAPYTIKFISDGFCCPGAASSQNIDGQMHTITTNETNLNSIFYQMMNTATSKCLRFKVIDACGQETDWCCMTTYSHQEGAYTGEWEQYQCIDEIDYTKLIPEYSSRPAVYPNPTTGEFQIVNNKGRDFKIYDLSGNLVHKKTLNTESSNVNFNVSDFISGNYILIIDDSIQINIIKK